MEIQGQDGTNLVLKQHTHTKTEFGRSKGFNTTDKTVSRSHIVLELIHPTKNGPIRLCFEVVGKNPIWVRRQNNEKVEVFKRDEVGELMAGDFFCVNGKNPVWFSLKCVEDEEEGIVGVTDIDPVKEFGFLVIGHEFDNYPKKMIRDVNDWNWFIEEPSKEIEDEEDEDTVSKNSPGNRRGKRKKGKDNDGDDDWTGESEDDKEIVTKLRKVRRPKYSTRSRDPDRPSSGLKSGRSLSMKTSAQLDEEDVEDESEDEDTLGGFIVDDEDEDLEERSNVDEEEEEEEDDDEDD